MRKKLQKREKNFKSIKNTNFKTFGVVFYAWGKKHHQFMK